ncbi:hypothetical protein H8957_014821 [Semnopithecus entellus]
MVLYSRGCKNGHILCLINSTSVLLTLKVIQKKDKCMKMFMSAFFIITKIGEKNLHVKEEKLLCCPVVL